MENHAITDGQVSASSQWSDRDAAFFARLNFKENLSHGKFGAWSSATNDLKQWLQIDLQSFKKLTRVATQGRNTVTQWVTRYKLQYGYDGLKFLYYRDHAQTTEKVIRLFFFSPFSSPCLFFFSVLLLLPPPLTSSESKSERVTFYLSFPLSIITSFVENQTTSSVCGPLY